MTTSPDGGLGVEALADACGALAWIADTLFVLEGRWSASMEDPQAVEHLAVNSRLHGWHAGLWQDLLPDSPALAGADRVAPPPGWVAAVEVAATLGDDAGDDVRLALLYRGLVARAVGIVAGLSAQAVGPGSAAAARVAGLVAADQHHDLAGGLRLLTNALRDRASIERSKEAVGVLDRAFVSL